MKIYIKKKEVVIFCFIVKLYDLQIHFAYINIKKNIFIYREQRISLV